MDKLEAERVAREEAARQAKEEAEKAAKKEAEATAAAIFMGRSGSSKQEIKDYIVKEFGYDLSRTCDEIRPNYHMDESCKGTVPEAIISFMEGKDFEDVIRTGISLGGDTDTLACIAGSIAEAYYGVPESMKKECVARIEYDMQKVLKAFDKVRKPGKVYEKALAH